MKLTAIITMIGLVATAVANPVPVPEPEAAQLEGESRDSVFHLSAHRLQFFAE
jgi:hypothetical protein